MPNIAPTRCVLTWCTLRLQFVLPPTAGHLDNHGNQLIEKWCACMCTRIVGSTNLETRLRIVTFAHANCRNNLWMAKPDRQNGFDGAKSFVRIRSRLRPRPGIICIYIYANAASRADLLQCRAITPPLCANMCALCVFNFFMFPAVGHLDNNAN